MRWEFAHAFEADADPSAAAAEWPRLPFLEIAPENYLGRAGRFGALLERVADRYPILCHGLSLSLGGHQPFEPDFLRALRIFLDRLGVAHYSDHLCFGWVDGVNLHDLLPVMRSLAEAKRIAARIRQVQDTLERPLAIEHVSAYLEPAGCTMPEPEFLQEVCTRADCKLLLDVNNLDVNAHNFDFDPFDWLARAPLDRVVHVHVAGPEWIELEGSAGGVWVDSHGSAPAPRTLDLLRTALQATGPVPVVLEWDTSIPPLSELLAQVARIDAVYTEACP